MELFSSCPVTESCSSVLSAKEYHMCYLCLVLVCVCVCVCVCVRACVCVYRRIEGLELMSSLQRLNLSYNRIEHVPVWLSRKLHSLHTLHLQHNLLTSVSPSWSSYSRSAAAIHLFTNYFVNQLFSFSHFVLCSVMSVVWAYTIVFTVFCLYG